MQRRGLRRTARRSLLERKADGVFVLVEFDRLHPRIGLVDVGRESTRVERPQVPLRLAFQNPVCEELARAARLHDAEREDAGFEDVWHAWRRTDQGVAVGRVGDRAVDHLLDACRAEDRHAANCLGDIALQPVEVVRKELKREGRRHRFAAAPMRRRLPLVGAEQQPVPLLAQVVAVVRVAQERQFSLAPRELADRVGDEVLVGHRHARDIPPVEAADLGRTVACRVDDRLARDRAGRRLDPPFAGRRSSHSGDAAVTDDPGSLVPRALRQRLGELRGIDVAIERIPLSALEPLRLNERVAALDIGGRQHLKFDALVAGHAGHVAELVHALSALGEADGAGDVIVDRIVDCRTEAGIEPRRIALQFHDAEAAGEVRAVARGMPRRARGQLVHLEEESVGQAARGEMIERAAADGAPADDHDP